MKMVCQIINNVMPYCILVSALSGVDAVHHVLETSVNSVAIVLHLFLLYLIKCHSTFRVPAYQILLGIDSGLDLLLGIVVLVGQPVGEHFPFLACMKFQVGLTGDGYFLMITNGFYAHSSGTYDCLMLTLFASVLHMNVLWIPVQFTYRYIFLCRRESGCVPLRSGYQLR